MSLKNFKTYQLALRFYKTTKPKGPPNLRDQFQRAASSVVLNLAEGSAKPTQADRRRFYHMALGSQRECAAILEMLDNSNEAASLCDELGACLFTLAKSPNC